MRREVLDAMLAAGCTAEQIVAAVAAEAEAEEAAREAKKELKRQKTAARVRAYRQRNACNALHDVTERNDALQKKDPPHPPKENTKRPPTGVQKVAAHSEEFERFRQAYPKRDGGHGWSKAIESFEAHRKAGVDPEDMIRGAESYAADRKRAGKAGTEFVMQAVTFLRGKHWPEWLEKAAPRPPANGWPLSIDEPTARATFLRGTWPDAFGPKPGVPGCKIPESVQREWLASKAA